jgi:hypothetical protein
MMFHVEHPIDVVLLTCERPNYSAVTSATFRRLNAEAIKAGRLRLWHADDASATPGFREDVGRWGWAPLVHTSARVGVTDMVRRIARRLEHQGAEWMLLLENDWESARPLPWPVIEAVQARGDIYALRLYGTHKGRGGTIPAGTRHRGRGGADPGWVDAVAGGETYQVGDIHWGNPPSVAKVAQVAWLHKAARAERDTIARSGAIDERVARVTENVFYHLGETRTPAFRA